MKLLTKGYFKQHEKGKDFRTKDEDSPLKMSASVTLKFSAKKGAKLAVKISLKLSAKDSKSVVKGFSLIKLQNRSP